MRILFVAEALHAGGAERQFVYLMNQLVGLGHEVFLYTWYPSDFYQEKDIPGVTWKKGRRIFKFDPFLLISIYNFAALHKVKVIQGVLDNGNLYAFLVGFLRSQLAKVYLSERSGKRILPRTVAIYKPYIHKKAGLTLANSNSGARFLDELGVSGHKIRVIRNSFDLNKFKFLPAEKERLRNELGLDKKHFYVIAVGRITPLKNQLGIAEAAGILRHHENIRWVFVGKGGNSYQNEVEEFLEQNNLKSLVEIRPASIDIMKYYQAADLGVLFSDYEGSPNAPLEAMLCGLPFICSNVGDIEHYANSLLRVIEPKNVGELAQAVSEQLSTSTSQRSKNQKEGLTTLHKLGLDVNRMADEYYNYYTGGKKA